MAATAGETVTHILVTHAHRDHSGGVRRLAAATGAPSHGVAAQRRRTAAGAPAADTGIDADFVPDMALADGALVAGDGWQVEAIATPGHAGDHLVFALAGSDLIFSGDHVMAWSTSVVAPPEGSMADYMASLDRLLARPEDTYLPGHGGPVTEAHDLCARAEGPSPRARGGDPRRAGGGRRNDPGDRRRDLSRISIRALPAPPACRCSPIWKT